jgi:hypothetical protein
MIASFPDVGSIKDSIRLSSKVYRNGSIGGEVLSRFQVVFDFPREKIYLKPNPSFRKKSFNNMSGLIVKAEGDRLRDFEIIEVRHNSAGDLAGIQAGDKILYINNAPTAEMDLSEVNNYFNTKPGKKITMQLLRGKQIVEKEFRLINEI